MGLKHELRRQKICRLERTEGMMVRWMCDCVYHCAYDGEMDVQNVLEG